MKNTDKIDAMTRALARVAPGQPGGSPSDAEAQTLLTLITAEDPTTTAPQTRPDRPHGVRRLLPGVTATAATDSRSAYRFQLPRVSLRIITVGALAAAITAGALVMGNPGGDGGNDAPRHLIPGLSMPAANAQTVLHSAAQAALHRKFTAPRPDQWVYIATRYQYLDKPRPGHVQTAQTPLKDRLDQIWKRADGKEMALIEDGKLVRGPTGGGMPPNDYATIAALPQDPDALLAWMSRQMSAINATEEQRHAIAFSTLASLLNNNLVPPAQEAAIYQAMAKIPGVALNQDSVDVEGQPALAIARTEDGWVRHEILFDPATYAYRGARDVAVADHSESINDAKAFIKKGAILSLSVRVGAGTTDQPGQQP